MPAASAPSKAQEKQIELKDTTTLQAVINGYGRHLLLAEDWGPLWVYRSADYAEVVVQASSWESAYEAVIDTLPPIAQSDVPEAYGFDGWMSGGYYDENKALKTYSPETAQERFDKAIEDAGFYGTEPYPELLEGYRYQSNATGTGIVNVSLNGELLEPLTPTLLSRLGWRLVVRAF